MIEFLCIACINRKNSSMKFILIGLLFISSLQAVEERFLEKIRFSKDLTVVVASGDFEPQGIGSFTVRFYRSNDEAVSQDFDVDNFVAGILLERDGVIEKVEIMDIDGDASDGIRFFEPLGELVGVMS